MTLRPWELLDSEILLDCRYLRVNLQKVRTASGTIIDDYHIVESPSWAATVAVTDDNQLVLVQQYRHGHRGPSLELPAGIVEPGEDPVAAAGRELLEETGFQAQKLAHLWKIRPEPARHDQWAHFALATGVTRAGAQNLDSTEDIRVVLRPLAELDAIVDEMVHAVHVGALLLAVRKGLIDPSCSLFPSGSRRTNE